MNERQARKKYPRMKLYHVASASNPLSLRVRTVGGVEYIPLRQPRSVEGPVYKERIRFAPGRYACITQPGRPFVAAGSCYIATNQGIVEGEQCSLNNLSDASLAALASALENDAEFDSADKFVNNI